ncbi:FlgD immunoglobulin-like domain containing protein [Candidatus Neomarinimicrobiota bacterium]
MKTIASKLKTTLLFAFAVVASTPAYLGAQTLVADTLDMGMLFIEESPFLRALTIHNNYSGTVSVQSVTFTNPLFTTNQAFPFDILISDSYDLGVVFSSETVGLDSTDLTIVSLASGASDATEASGYITADVVEAPVITIPAAAPINKYLLIDDAPVSHQISIDNFNGGSDLIWEVKLGDRSAPVTFTKADYADYENAANWDVLTESVALTRGDSRGLYNPFEEPYYDYIGETPAPPRPDLALATDNGGTVSPVGTEWAYGLSEDLAPEDYAYWLEAVNYRALAMVGNDISLHIIEEDVYFDLVFTSWTAGCGSSPPLPGVDKMAVCGGGGFSYIRTAVTPAWLTATFADFSDATADPDTLAVGESVSIDIAIDISDLTVGEFEADIIFTSNDPFNTEIVIPVFVHVDSVNVQPNDFDLFVPENGSMLTDLTPYFSWEQATDPNDSPPRENLIAAKSLSVDYPIETFEFYLSTDSLFSGVEPIVLTEPTYTPTTNLDEDNIYYWKTVAIDHYGAETPSARHWFWTNSANSAPNPFTLIEPAIGSDQATLQPTFTWNTATEQDLFDQISYQLVLGTSINTLAVVYDGPNTTFTPTVVNSLSDNAVYYWKVVAIDQAGATTANTGDYYHFMVNTANDQPGLFALLSPPDESMTRTLTPVFNWRASDDPEADVVAYHFYFDTDETFAEVDPIVMDSLSYSLPGNLDEDQLYYWKVVAVDGDGAETPSEVWTFWTNSANSAPDPFTIISPAIGSDQDTLQPTFTWTTATEADLFDEVNYRLVVGTSINFLYVFYEGPDTTWTVDGHLSDNAVWYWRVEAVDLAGATTVNTGNYHYFMVNTDNDNPGLFALLSPPDESMTSTLDPTFNWRESDDPEADVVAYHFYYGTDAEFTEGDPIVLETTSHTLEGNLEEDQLYYWQVVAVDGDGGETPSALWSFWTNSTNSAPGQFSLITPESGSEQDTLKPAFNWTAATDVDLFDQVSYRLVLGSNINDLAVVYEGPNTSFDALEIPLEDNSVYYWRVVATDLAGATTVNTGDYQHFIVNITNDQPGIFAILSPPDQSMVSTLDPTFYWRESDDPEADVVAYHFYFDTDETFAEVDPIVMDSLSYSLPANLDEDQLYYWQVVAVDGNGGETPSALWSFWTNQLNNPPTAFNLLEPGNNLELLTLTPTFSWGAATDTDIYDGVTYSLFLGSSSGDLAVAYTGSETTFTVQAEADLIADNTAYIWGVVARDQAGATTGNADDYFSFAINAFNEPPVPVHTITPSDSSIEITLIPEFYWMPSIDPDPGDIVEYTLLYWTDPDTITAVPLGSNEFSLIDSLLDNSTYHWTVVSTDAHDSSTVSDTSVFWTDEYPEPPAPFLALLPANDSQSLSNDVVFTWNIAADPDPLDFATYNLIYATDWADSATYLYIAGIADSTIEANLISNTEYFWLVEAVDKDGQLVQSNEGQPMRLVVGTLVINASDLIPTEFALHQNYPNPFNPTTILEFDLPRQVDASLKVYDIMGREVITIVNESMVPGYHRLAWNGRTNNGQQVPSGLYIARLVTAEYSKTIKMVLLK